MGYINIFVSKDAYLFVKNEQLFLKNKDKQIDYPLEDINSIMIENLETTISTYALSKFAQNGILTFVCNQNHLPCGVVLPYCEHYQTLSVHNFQTAVSKPLNKQLWQSIIKNKIKNQNEVLNICGKYDKLLDFYQTVTSGDGTNNEAKASLRYFKELFGKNFVRRDDSNDINAFLNYGYSIVRGFVARSVVVHGLTPFLGIFHSNGFNQFNLADDLIEVFRPVVDLFVKIYLSDEKTLSSDVKAKIYNLVNVDVIVDDQKQPLSYAIDMLVQSYVRSIKENKNVLKNIDICGLEIHEYE